MDEFKIFTVLIFIFNLQFIGSPSISLDVSLLSEGGNLEAQNYQHVLKPNSNSNFQFYTSPPLESDCSGMKCTGFGIGIC